MKNLFLSFIVGVVAFFLNGFNEMTSVVAGINWFLFAMFIVFVFQMLGDVMSFSKFRKKIAAEIKSANEDDANEIKETIFAFKVTVYRGPCLAALGSIMLLISKGPNLITSSLSNVALAISFAALVLIIFGVVYSKQSGPAKKNLIKILEN